MAENSEVRSSFAVIPVKLPPDLVDWLDLHIAKLRVELLRAGKRAPAPTRSSYIREILQKIRQDK